MNDTRTIRRLVFALLPLLLFAAPLVALEPGQPARDLLGTRFFTDEGLPGEVIDGIAQTPDGFLWLVANGASLVRYDGKNYYVFHKLRPRTLAVAPDGDLWLGTPDELIRVPSSDFNQFTLGGRVSLHPGTGKANAILCIRFSRAGVMWVGTGDGLFRYEGGRFTAVGPRIATRQIEETPDGHLLVTTDHGFIELAGSEKVPHPPMGDRLGVKETEIYDVLRDRRGNTWYCTAKGVARESGGRIEKLGIYIQSGHAGYRAYEDAQGTVWIGKEDGLFRGTPAGIEPVATGIQVRSLYGDRDGNLWVGTNGDALHRYRSRTTRVFTTADGLPNDLIMTTLVARDGSVWTGANCGGITRFDGARFRTFDRKDGLLNECVWSLAEDANGDLWIGTWGGGAFHYHDGKFTQYSKSQGMGGDVVSSIVAARDGSIWFGTRGGVTRLRNGQFRNFTKADGLSANAVLRVLEDGSGTIWVGTREGLDRLTGDRFEHLAAVPKTFIVPVGEDGDGGLILDADMDSAVYRMKYGRVNDVKGLPSVYDVVQAEQGELWLGGAAITRVLPGKLVHVRPRDEPLDCERFSPADGLPNAQVSTGYHCLALGGDGKLWAATAKGLAMLDLRRMPVTHAKPSIYLNEITIGRDTRHGGREVILPAGANHVEIAFAVVEITSPEKIRMQYRLDGVDSEWLDATSNPRAIYSNIPVGAHALHIRACNRSGIWDRQGVAFPVIQQPYFYQTRWFLVAVLALGALLVVALIRLRVGQISRRMSALFDERLAERTRVAREIHDTFLQTVQGSKMVADHALRDRADHARMVRAVEQLSAWLGQATEEGRAALNSLRASTTEKNDLAAALRRAIDECRAGSRAEISLSVRGESKEMHPVVRDEVYRIGYEGLRNACAHSGADRVEVSLEYGHDLTLRVTDNGVGIEPALAEAGREGHFGLRGMRERAERINAVLTLVGSPGSGTAMTLVVPGRIAFHT